jgi:hypothetical protein
MACSALKLICTQHATMMAHIIFSISRSSSSEASRVFVFSNAFAMFTAFWWWGIIWWMKVTMGSLFARIDFML